MIKKIIKIIGQHKIITGIIIILIVAGGYFGLKALKGNQAEVRYVLAAVEKGTIAVSVSGSGQVSASNQIEIKPEVSGDVVYLGLKNDQEVKAGTLLAQIDSRNAQKSIRDAEVALESAQAKLEELLSQPDAKSLLQAQNALAQAERDLDEAKEDYEEVEIDAERTLASAYEDSYSDVSAIYFKLSDYMKDLKDVLGTEERTEKHINDYEIILGSDSIFIKELLDDYYPANDSYNESFAFFRGVYRYDDRDTIYQLIEDTLTTAKSISQALESARHMFDAIMVKGYSSTLRIASHIDTMQPEIESDVTSINSNINSLQQILDTIDDTIKETPEKIEDAKLAIQSAQEKFEEKKLDLEELMVGADPLDIKSQQNTVAQKEDALWDAKESLAKHFIYAPFDGVITGVNSKVAKGDSVSSATVLASIITQQKIAEITLNEIDAAQVKVKQKATLLFDAVPNLSITGEVVEVDTLGAVTQGVVSYGVKIAFDIDDERVKPGMSVSVNIILESKQNVLLVPISAVKATGGSGYVEVLVNGQPQRKTVTTGLNNDTMIEIIDGLAEGEQIITQSITTSGQQQSSQQQTGQKQDAGAMQGMMRMMR